MKLTLRPIKTVETTYYTHFEGHYAKLLYILVDYTGTQPPDK